MDISKVHGEWRGSAELWLDPLGDQVQRSDCTISVEARALRYTWAYEGKPQQGSITLRDGEADFIDTWHSVQPMKCVSVPGAVGIFQVQGSYGPDADWGWRIGACSRAPTGELVLQMTNIAPWGEEVRAVRMICRRQ